MLVDDSLWISCWSHWNADLQSLCVQIPREKNWTCLGNHQTARQESEKGRKNVKPLRFLTSEVGDLVIQDSGAQEESRSYTKHHQASRDKSSAEAETSLSACWDVEIKGSTGVGQKTRMPCDQEIHTMVSNTIWWITATHKQNVNIAMWCNLCCCFSPLQHIYIRQTAGKWHTLTTWAKVVSKLWPLGSAAWGEAKMIVNSSANGKGCFLEESKCCVDLKTHLSKFKDNFPCWCKTVFFRSNWWDIAGHHMTSTSKLQFQQFRLTFRLKLPGLQHTVAVTTPIYSNHQWKSGPASQPPSSSGVRPQGRPANKDTTGSMVYVQLENTTGHVASPKESTKHHEASKPQGIHGWPFKENMLFPKCGVIVIIIITITAIVIYHLSSS